MEDKAQVIADEFLGIAKEFIEAFECQQNPAGMLIKMQLRNLVDEFKQICERHDVEIK